MAERKRKRVKSWRTVVAGERPVEEPPPDPVPQQAQRLVGASATGRILSELQDAYDALVRARATRGISERDSARLNDAVRLVLAVFTSVGGA